MRLGEFIATYDVGLALRGKRGTFQVTTPTGEIYEVTCKSDHPISDLEWSSDRTENLPFLIRRVAESASVPEARATAPTQEERQTVSSRGPVALERPLEEGYSSSSGDIGLLYLEDDPRTGGPSACLYLKGEPRDHESETKILMTPRCATFNELDPELRRLQAQLDEIRSRAKKMFYKAHVMAASA